MKYLILCFLGQSAELGGHVASERYCWLLSSVSGGGRGLLGDDFHVKNVIFTLVFFLANIRENTYKNGGKMRTRGRNRDVKGDGVVVSGRKRKGDGREVGSAKSRATRGRRYRARPPTFADDGPCGEQSGAKWRKLASTRGKDRSVNLKKRCVSAFFRKE